MHQLKNDHITINLLNNGAIGTITADNIMVNQVAGNALDGSMANIYLRIQADGQYHYTPLIGPASTSHLSLSKNGARWQGQFNGVEYTLTLLLGSTTWFWHVTLHSSQSINADLTYVQDLGLGEPGFVNSNEAYVSQYLDQHPFTSDGHITITARQNQPQAGQYPYLQQGALTSLASYATDGFQFFGTDYKSTNEPSAMSQADLPSRVLQYECALTALRSAPMTIKGNDTKVTFYASFKATQPNGNLEKLIPDTDIQANFALLSAVNPTWQSVSLPAANQSLGQPLTGTPLTETQLTTLFPQQRQVERGQTGQVLSLFTPDDTHVVLPEKENQQERLTGNIIMAERTMTPTQPVLAATQFMPGVFESHVVFGNTNMNIMITNTRSALNWFKVTGTRIYVRPANDTQYHLLTMPSAYAMTFNGGDWYYQLDDDTLKISDDASSTEQQVTLRFASLNHQRYDVWVTSQWDTETLGEKPLLDITDNTIALSPEVNTAMAKIDPDRVYSIRYSHNAQAFNIGREEIILGHATNDSTHQLVTAFDSVSQFSIVTQTNTVQAPDSEPIATSREQHHAYLESLLRHFQVTTNNPAKQDMAEQTNLVLRWYAHDALVHMLSPHGLEQYGGAAWGTRDVSQGPTELFLSTGHYDIVRQIILHLYSHQFSENGNWPQWFMYDEYSGQFADESHGDVIVWPLKVVTDYLLATQDTSVLSEVLPYMSLKKHKMLAESESLLDHIKRQLAYITSHFLYNTKVSAYGDGDWDDTLQPADARQKKEMASTWTEELTIETLRHAAQAFASIPDFAQSLQTLADDMMGDFKRYFMQDDVLPGFIKMDANHHVTPIIHPNDGLTGIDYRLLPLSQGVLSHILDEQQSEHALQLITQHLLFPDGVRLMNKPSTYRGGVSHIFKRAEQAANFGREIGLLYVHAHIRYADAVAQTGDQAEAWRLLQLVNPINIQSRVSNAALRQANVYFSSSDAAFPDRYAAQEHFDDVRNQSVSVKGGWRLYSSGPGIYIATLLNSVFKLADEETFNSTFSLPFDTDYRVSVSK
ncbi:MAG: cellobiose phosphorylase [Schleiferilactobacillus perolens]|jgi:cellobiose phosphorylase|uniref:Cyclic beta 1-2 glucan ligase n=1 Tax=Schleiferilactobacillus perolens DSM 12744 TaxID=1423792 RepID=A0A0R1N2K5_9LACO|nr:hypothetical protein [Schleiferilactobacillus perolens]KRL14445.1 cyclic beta 1-2 glucan ligase [Schleiferilactobacillus perolens DSM 12744]